MTASKTSRSIGKHACQACRRRKTRCYTDTLKENGKCRRCQAQKIDCEWKEISKTRKRTRTGSRITELEEKIVSLTAAMNNLDKNNLFGSSVRDSPDDPHSTNSLHRYESTLDSGSTENAGLVASDTNVLPAVNSSVPPPRRLANVSYGKDHSSSVSGFETLKLTSATKKKLIRCFCNTLLPQYPVVRSVADMPLESLEEYRPHSTSAMITAGCSVLEPQLFKDMHMQNTKSLAHVVHVQGHKSLDLLQALLIIAVWGHPPTDLEHLNISQWSHAACTMAMDLGFGGRTSWQAQNQDIAELSQDASDSMLERYRAMFGVYLTCSRIAISFRRQRIISFSPSTGVALVLFKQYATDTNDQRLVAWLQLHNIAEDVEAMKTEAEMSSDPAVVEHINIKEKSTRFEQRLREWEAMLDPKLLTASLEIDLTLCKSKLHELVICFDHNVQSLSLPSLATKSDAPLPGSRAPLSPTYTRILLSFISDCQSILDVLLKIGPENIRSLPLLTFFRIPYAFKALAMLQKRVTDPTDKISQIIDNDTLKWAHYARSVSKVLEEASAHGLYAPAAVVLQIRDSVGNMHLAESIPTPSLHTRTLRSRNAPAPEEYMPTPPDVVIGAQDVLHDNTAFGDLGVLLWPDDYGFAFMSEQDTMSNFYYGMDNVSDQPVGW
ncbi:hypothetical protein TRIATDRAFT_314369 [Trichoderma atroviride IMI 206040]|uniref:Zn(2)-C6 fungal-type domain-containing protein n=1 Tax=Hypocrea atroviridis (strain ATCC 20476 / IMI 206040) TaxID=452589 RepID=G9NFS8_HYPAI|nr:uncharacterized protein TRIATDRAFT_314369 [Trichoderma atroviride IMI 206040]EHK50144.1 hypothetical protein TRIATDRAFT_314369 [Trichoderma atroviride IMI 206040]